jgi:hypothetical protein
MRDPVHRVPPLAVTWMPLPERQVDEDQLPVRVQRRPENEPVPVGSATYSFWQPGSSVPSGPSAS